MARRRLVSFRQLAEFGGVTLRAARDWAVRPDFPTRSGRRGWAVAEVRAWLTEHATSSHAQAGTPPAGVAALRERKLQKEIEYLDARVNRSVEESETVSRARAVEDRETRLLWARAIAAVIVDEVERWRMAQAARAETAPMRTAIDVLARDLRATLKDGYVEAFEAGVAKRPQAGE